MHSQVYSNGPAAATASPGSITAQEHNSEAALFVLSVFGLLIMEGGKKNAVSRHIQKKKKFIPKAMHIQGMLS